MTEREAIKGSIEHWKVNKAIVLAEWDSDEFPHYGDTCPLCEYSGYHTEKHADCARPCPLFECDDNECCEEWRDCRNAWTRQDQSEWETTCQILIDKLESLLES